MLLLPRYAVTIDLASGVDCNICNHFFADEFRPLDADVSWRRLLTPPSRNRAAAAAGQLVGGSAVGPASTRG